MKDSKAKAAIAIFVVALLGIFGNSWLGGETWISAAGAGEAGWRAYVGPFTPQPPSIFRPFVIPLIMVCVLLAVSLLGMILNRQSNNRSDVETGDPRAPLH